MIINDYYSWSDNWRIETIERPHDVIDGTEYFLENTAGGKIIIDKPVNDVLEFLATADTKKTFAEIDLQKIVSTGLLDIILTVFAQVEVLKINQDEKEVEEIEVIETDVLPNGPLISIVIINYNGVNHLPDLLNSLLEQTYVHWEIIIVDNHSTDDSCHLVKTRYPKIRLLEIKKNIGFAAAVNKGVQEIEGEHILVLNNDIVMDKNALYYLAKKVITLSSPEVKKPKKWAAIAPKMKFYNNPAFINAIGNSLYPITWGSDNFIGSVDLGQFDHFKAPMSACFGAVLLNREAWANVGPLDARYKFYYEDMDWSFRAQLYGYSIEAEPQSVFYHKFGASMSLKSQSFKLRFIVGNRLYFTLKNLESQTIKRFIHNYIFEDIKSALIYLKRMNLSLVLAYIRGYTRLILSLPGLYLKRNVIREKRENKGVTDAAILARCVPLNTTWMDRGTPILDVYSLRTNYAFLLPEEDYYNSEAGMDIISWRLRPPRKDKRSDAKIYIEFSFYLVETGYYDIHLLGLIKRKSDRIVYLDGQQIKPTIKVDKKNKKLIMNFMAGENILIRQGRHILELGHRNQVYAIVIRKSNASGGQGLFSRKPPLDPTKAFENLDKQLEQYEVKNENQKHTIH